MHHRIPHGEEPSACYQDIPFYRITATTANEYLGALGVLIAALGTLGGVHTVSLRELLVVLLRGAVQVLLEHGLGFDSLELGLEVLEPRRVAAAVGTAARIG